MSSTERSSYSVTSLARSLDYWFKARTSALARASARGFAGSEVVRGGGSETLRCVASDPSIHPTNPRVSSDARPSRPFPIPIAVAAVPHGLGLASGTYVPAAGPRRTQDRPASLDGCDGIELRPRDPGGSYLLGLGGRTPTGSATFASVRRCRFRSGGSRSPGATLPLC